MANELVCDVCGLPIDPDGKYCWGHEYYCPRHTNPDSDEPCECDLNYHEACCPDCNEEEDGERDAPHLQD